MPLHLSTQVPVVVLVLATTLASSRPASQHPTVLDDPSLAVVTIVPASSSSPLPPSWRSLCYHCEYNRVKFHSSRSSLRSVQQAVVHVALTYANLCPVTRENMTECGLYPGALQSAIAPFFPNCFESDFQYLFIRCTLIVSAGRPAHTTPHNKTWS